MDTRQIYTPDMLEFKHTLTIHIKHNLHTQHNWQFVNMKHSQIIYSFKKQISKTHHMTHKVVRYLHVSVERMLTLSKHTTLSTMNGAMLDIPLSLQCHLRVTMPKT